MGRMHFKLAMRIAAILACGILVGLAGFGSFLFGARRTLSGSDEYGKFYVNENIDMFYIFVGFSTAMIGVGIISGGVITAVQKFQKEVSKKGPEKGTM